MAQRNARTIVQFTGLEKHGETSSLLCQYGVALKKRGYEKYAVSTEKNISRICLVDREGIEPPTQGFSVLCSTN